MSSLHEVMQQITKCRKAGEVSYSNFYPGESMDTEYQMTAGEKTVVFWRQKEGVFRVYFHAADLEELKVLLKETPEHAVIDYLCREGAAPFEAIEEGGYHHYATYLKRQIQVEAEEKVPEGKMAKLLYDMYQPDCAKYAVESDVPQIYELLLENFDLQADHIPSEDDLLQIVKEKEVMIYKIGDKIECFFIYRREGKKLYCAFSYNHASADILYSIERQAGDHERQTQQLTHGDNASQQITQLGIGHAHKLNEEADDAVTHHKHTHKRALG